MSRMSWSSYGTNHDKLRLPGIIDDIESLFIVILQLSSNFEEVVNCSLKCDTGRYYVTFVTSTKLSGHIF